MKSAKNVFIPFLKSIARRLLPWAFLLRAQKHWRRPDITIWPPTGANGKSGLERYEYSLFSQNGEDGILRHLFSLIGFRSRLFLEFGFGVRENNSLRLILKEEFGGVFIDGSESTVRMFNTLAKKNSLLRTKAVRHFINIENLESIIKASGLPREIDLLSIDVDGNDYWFWEAINYLAPRIVVIEYNASLGPELSLTVPYDPLFERHKKHESGFYGGASISALEKLGIRKGYALIGCDSNGVNAFFIRKDALAGPINILPARAAYRPHKSRLKRGFSQEEQYNIIKGMPHVTI